MQINILTPTYAVSPQMTAQDVAELKAAGYGTIICNRPDQEVGAEHQAATIGAAVEAAGLTFVVNPVEPGQMTESNITTQRAAIDAADAPVFAYCRSGNRSAVVWALAMAADIPVDDIMSATAAQGYDLSGLRQYLDAAANQN